jgi:AAA domain, putative AbiEii toxin, Type IV TA system
MAAHAPELGGEDEAVKREMRISRIGIRDYKAIESLELELPPPKTVDEPDAFVLGSKNGVGKTSVLEACAIGLIAAAFPDVNHQASTLCSLLIRSGTDEAVIDSTIDHGGKTHAFQVRILPNEFVAELGSFPSRRPNESLPEAWLPRLLGVDSEPLASGPVLVFHSYRKVREGNFAIESIVDSRRYAKLQDLSGRGRLSPTSTFKIALIRALMARSGMFEDVDADTDDVLDKLNELMTAFAEGRVDKLRPSPDGTFELRVAPTNGGPSYSFDGLSSGQKEVIATLFLIWHTTRDAPSVVLIDEPELHLNAEWQRLFVRTLWSLAPWNQYIMATHSEEIFGSVTEDRRLLLQPG